VDFGQFTLKGSKFVDPLVNEAQLIGNKRPQPGPHRRAPLAF